MNEMPEVPEFCIDCKRPIKGTCIMSVGNRHPLSVDIICGFCTKTMEVV